MTYTLIRKTYLYERIFESDIVTEAELYGKYVIVPIIQLRSDTNLPFTITRMLLPFRVDFAMTVNKFQCYLLS